MNTLPLPLRSASVFGWLPALCLTGVAVLGFAVTAPAAEPGEWIFQGSEHDSPTAAGVLFLRSQGEKVSGEWRAGGTLGRGVPVTGTAQPEGKFILRFADPDGKETTGIAQLLPAEDDPTGERRPQLITDLGTDREYHFRAVPVAADAPPLPRYDVAFRQGREGISELQVSYPQFDTAGPDGAHWQTINARLAEFVERERGAFLAAVKPLPADLAAVDPPSFGVQFAIRSRHRDTLSIEFTVTSYTGGPHGRASHPGFNYHFPTSRFLAIENLFAPESEWRAALAARLNAGLFEEGATEKGQTPVSAGAVARLQWTLDLQEHVVFHLAAEELGPGMPEATVRIRLADLRQAGLVRAGGVLDAAR